MLSTTNKISLTNKKKKEHSRTAFSNILLNKKYNCGVCELFQFAHENFQSCTSCPKCRRKFDYYEVCQLFTWIFPSKYLVYTFIWCANKHRFFSFKIQEMVWCCKNIHLSTIFYYTIFELVELTNNILFILK